MNRPRMLRLILAGLAIAVSAMPARAQLYVANTRDGTISEYDADTGALIKDSMVTGLGPTCGMVYDHGALYVTNRLRRVVAKYDAQTGIEINRELVTGLNMPSAIAVSGPDLYVASFADLYVGMLSMVGRYNSDTGAAVFYKLLLCPGYISGLAVHGNHLFVAHGYGPAIDEYDTTSGGLLQQGFIRDEANSAVLAQEGNDLWMNHAAGFVTKHDLDTGHNVLGPQLPLVSGLTDTGALAVSGDDLFIANETTYSIGKYNASTGAVINASFITGLGSPVCLAVVPRAVESNSGTGALGFDRRSLMALLTSIPASVIHAIGVCVLVLVIAFLIRGLVHMGGAGARSRREAVFPNGVKKVTILSFSGEPAAGCLLVADSVQSQLAGLQVGDLIVALDGTQVENNEQYTLVDSSTTDSRMRWIVWRDDRYHEISAWVPERKLEARLRTHLTPSASVK
jgi:outer membrane protein assembly factor BamB